EVYQCYDPFNVQRSRRRDQGRLPGEVPGSGARPALQEAFPHRGIAVAHISTWRHAQAGQPLMKEGEPGDEFCILAEGEVKVTKRGRLLSVLGAGEPVGEMAYLPKNDKRRGAGGTLSPEADIIYIQPAN